LPIAPNLLARDFIVSAPDRAWVSDITYIPTAEGWLYLAGINDLFSGGLVGYALMNERMTKNLVIQALFRAVSNQKPKPGLILHSDRGSQYCAYGYQAIPVQLGMRPSMGRKGDCWDNAPESFWGTLKNELVHYRQYLTRHRAKREIAEYIEVFYLCPWGITGNANRRDWVSCPLSHSPSNISSN
jgi:putative transposase